MEIKIISFDEIEDLPPVIYKYRNWTNDLHKEIISEQIVFMARPTSFEDPLDCKLLKRYDLLTNNDIYNKYLEDSKRTNPNWTRSQHRKFARQHSKKSSMRDKQRIRNMQLEHLNELDGRFGILSLTANPKNYKMWCKYSDNHQGFCIGFDTKKMFRYVGGGGPVSYYDILPDIMPSEPDTVAHIKQIFSKESKWDFEEEYRTSRFYTKEAGIQERRIKLPIDCFKEIIFGAHQSEKQREDIISSCREKGLQVEFYIEKLDNGNDITIEKIPSH